MSDTSQRVQIVGLLQELRELYEPEGAGIWLYSPHKQWGGLSAVEMIALDRVAEVLTALDQLASGAFI